eukprot:gene12459-biopygen6469
MPCEMEPSRVSFSKKPGEAERRLKGKTGGIGAEWPARCRLEQPGARPGFSQIPVRDENLVPVAEVGVRGAVGVRLPVTRRGAGRRPQRRVHFVRREPLAARGGGAALPAAL